ncbi:MAG: hypothetical protein WC505_05350 [Patescibacteria group bacterium]
MKYPKGLTHIVLIITIALIAGLMVGAAWYFEQNKGEETSVVNVNTASANTNVNTNSTMDEEQQTYSYATAYHAFSFDLPKSWTVSESNVHAEERQGLVIASDSESDPGAAYLTVSFYNNPRSLDEWVAEHTEELIRSHEDIIAGESDYTDARRHVVVGEMKGLFKHAHCYVQGDGVVYEAYFFSELENWERYKEIFNRACSTFQVSSELIDTSDWLTYENEEYGYSFSYPGDWSLDEVEDTETRISCPIGACSWSLMVIKTDQSVEDFIASYGSNESEDMRQFNQILSQEDIIINGRTGVRLEGSTTLGIHDAYIFFPTMDGSIRLQYHLVNSIDDIGPVIVNTFNILE